MTENNAAQPGLTDDQIEALAKKHICPHHDRLDAVLPNRVPYQQTEQFRRVKALIGDVLSKLRAEGVQAGDAQIANSLMPKLQSLLDRMANDPHTGTMFEADGDTLRDAMHLCRAVKVNAALASAPVAGEAPTDAEIIDMAVEPLGIDYDRMPYGIVKFARALLDQYAAPRASEAVRDALAELVRLQDAKDSQNHFPNPQRSKEWAEYRRLWPAAMEQARAALPTQADKDGGDCAKGAGDE
jgi:hypothetical protein